MTTPVDIDKGNAVEYVGAAGVDDNDTVIETEDVSRFDTFSLSTVAGVTDVYVSLDGSTYLADPIAILNFSAVDVTPVLVTVAGQLFQFHVKCRKIKILQNGATAVTGARLLGWRWAKG